MNKRTGIIYCVMNKLNRKKYIGQTIQLLATRWEQHLSKVSRGSQTKLHRAIAEHGANKFLVKEIERTTIDELNNREMYWIYTGDTYNNGYNETLGGAGTRTITDEEAILIRELWNYGWFIHDISHEVNHCGAAIQNVLVSWNISQEDIIERAAKTQNLSERKVAQIDIETGKIIKIFDTVSKAGKAVNIKSQPISNCCTNRTKSCRGYYWRYADELDKIDIELMQYSGDLPKRYGSGRNRQYEYARALDLWRNGKNRRQIAETMGCSPEAVSYMLDQLAIPRAERVCHRNGYNEIAIQQTLLSGEVIAEYKSAVEAAVTLGVSSNSHISKAVRDRTAAYGYLWKRVDGNG